MININELKQISDILDEREKELEVREAKLADRTKTLASAYKEFKLLVDKIYG